VRRKSAKLAKTGQKKNRSKVALLLVIAALAAGVSLIAIAKRNPDHSDAQSVRNDEGATRMALPADFEVVASYPHDPKAFLQGLVWHDGGFYESTGHYGQSTLRRVEFPSGKVLRQVALDRQYFGEGLALVGDKLVQLTWQTHRGFVYDRDSFRLIREFSYSNEGWGLAWDGTNLIMSDGSDTLTYLDPTNYEPVKRLRVTLNSRPARQLNELEFIEGEIWANVWQTDTILRIDPATGRVSSTLDLRGLLKPDMRTGSEDVLNGIAYDAASKRIFVSGKFWPRVFEIRLK
jgi:glutamine cyclotransferase